MEFNFICSGTKAPLFIMQCQCCALSNVSCEKGQKRKSNKRAG